MERPEKSNACGWHAVPQLKLRNHFEQPTSQPGPALDELLFQLATAKQNLHAMHSHDLSHDNSSGFCLLAGSGNRSTP